MNSAGGITISVLSILCLSACSEPESLELSPARQPGAYQENCNSASSQFSLVGGDRYVGSIIPESYFDRPGNQDSLGIAHGAWTPSPDDVQDAEMNLLRVFTEAIQHPESLDEGSKLYPQRSAFAKHVIAKIARDLPLYRRQYAGLVVNGKRQVLIKAFIPGILGSGWLCHLVSGNDFEEQLWQLRYDVQSQTYEGFEIGN